MTPYNDHVLTVEFDHGSANSDWGTIECFAPEHSMCHAVWDCGCEEWDSPRAEGGLPIHSVTLYTDDGDVEVDHVGWFDPHFCNLREWHDGSEESFAGKVSIPVVGEWTGDGYRFRPTS